MTVTPIAKKVPRDGFGRPKVKAPDGSGTITYTRCTTYVDVLEDKYNLQRWQQRMVALGLADRPDLQLAVAAMERGDRGDALDKTGLNKLCEQAQEAAKAHARATIGTSLHSLTERIDRGQELGVIPEAYQRDMAAYAEATREITALHIERFTVLDALKVGGTPDRIGEHEGKLKILDVKTGDIEWGALKIAMQLAIYAHSDFYDPETGARTPITGVDQNEAVVIHLPAGEGRCDLHRVDIAAGWEAVACATAVRDWRSKGKKLLTPITAASAQAELPTSGPVNDELANRIASAATVDELGAIWSAHHTDFTDEHIELASARKRLLTEQA